MDELLDREFVLYQMAHDSKYRELIRQRISRARHRRLDKEARIWRQMKKVYGIEDKWEDNDCCG